MKLRLLAVLSLGIALFAGSFGCSSAQNGAGSASGAAGSANLAGAGNLNGDGGADTSACLQQPTPARTQGTVMSLQLALNLSGKPFVFGQPNALSDGGSLVPLNLRFYISEVQLQPTSGDPVAVDLVTEAGDPEPYGVHLFNAEDPDSSTLRVLAPAGQYSSFSFALGIKLACNQELPADLSDPLTDTSQMTWPHTGGFLFFRYEGRSSAADGSASTPAGIPPAVHMGGDITKELVPRITVPGEFSVSASGSPAQTMTVAMDQIFKGATADIDVSDVAVGILSTPEAIAGERLRRSLPQLHVFLTSVE